MARIEFSANRTHLRKHPHPRPPPPSDQDETRNSSVDYISELPVAIILHIFSFLTTKDAIKTSVLSKRWRSIWTANPHISFSMPSCCGTSRSKFRSFMSFMNAVLLRCTAVKMKSFLFSAPYLFTFELACNDRWLRSAIGPTIDRWLQFTVEHDLEEVSITLHNDVYTLPQFFFRCTTLVSFHVYGCSFSTVGAVNWTSLKRLRFDHAKLKDNAIMRILNGCPILEFVELKDCWGFKHIKIKSRGMREMVIHSHTFSGEVLKISAPHLLKLRILGNSDPGEFKVDKVSSLVEVELNFKIRGHSPGHGKAQGDLVKTLLQSLHHVTKLVIGSLYLQVLSLTEPREVFLPSLECRHLMFRVAEDHEGEAGIAKILESSPYLEKLILQMTCAPTSRGFLEFVGCRIFDAKDGCNSSNRCLMHLKNIEIVDPGANWLAWEPVLSLLKFLLQKAPWLDKIEISSNNSRVSKEVNPWVLLEVVRRILTHPNRSPSLKLILSYPSQGCPSTKVLFSLAEL